LDKKQKFSAHLELRVGRGYVLGSQDERRAEIRVLPVDALLSPVTLVTYAVEDTRVGQITDYDKLILEIWTDGRITPAETLKEATIVLKRHLNVFDAVAAGEVIFDGTAKEIDDGENRLRKLLNMSVNKIELPVRTANCLNNANIMAVGELAMKSEAEMLRYRNFGKSL
jgi:DNA-directed RNA polymerase subunit alpha